MVELEDGINPDDIFTRRDFALALTELRERSGLTIRIVARKSDIPLSTLSDYFSGRHLPQDIASLPRILQACGVEGGSIHPWLDALRRVRALPKEPWDTTQQLGDDNNQPGLIFRVYIPAERLYATETSRLVSLFRQWLTTIRSQGIRQVGYRTASGEVIELFADSPLVQNLPEQLDRFSHFLTLCSADPSAAVEMLVDMGLGRATSTDLVARFDRDVRRLQLDLTHERERRILDIRHTLEEGLVSSGYDLGMIPSDQINALIESRVPGPSASASLALLAGPSGAPAQPPLILNINQQFVTALESTIIQSVGGRIHLGPQAKQLLELIDRFGGDQKSALESAVHEVEDADAPTDKRSAAGRRLRQFFGQLPGVARDVGVDLLKKYLESKLGL